MRLFPNVSTEFKSSVVARILRLWLGTHRYRFVVDDPSAGPNTAPPSIYVFWHEMLLFPAFTHADGAITPLISLSTDGELISQVVERLGGRVIRGATDRDRKDRGGSRALREMMRYGKDHHVAIPMDGPVGPRRKVSAGTIVLASRNGMPVVPMGIAPGLSVTVGPRRSPIHLPLLCCRVWYVSGKAVHIGPNLCKSGRDEAIQRVQAAMDDVQERAERFAAGGRPPVKPMFLAEVRAL